jgi:hypothetical protein
MSCDTAPPAQAPPETIVITQPAPPGRVALDLAYSFTAGRSSTTLRNLFADLEPGARVTAACRTKKRKRCPRTKDLARMIGTVKTLTIRRRKAPSLKTLCVPPGAASPSAC